MLKLFLCICAGLLIVVMYILGYALKQKEKLRQAKKEIELCHKAFVFLCGEDEKFLRTKLKDVNFIIEEVATLEVQISSDIRVVSKAKELLEFALKENKNNPLS